MSEAYIEIQLAANDDGFLSYFQALDYAKNHGVEAEFTEEYARCRDGVDSCDFANWLGC